MSGPTRPILRCARGDPDDTPGRHQGGPYGETVGAAVNLGALRAFEAVE